jgi:hypothetical protein
MLHGTFRQPQKRECQKAIGGCALTRVSCLQF